LNNQDRARTRFPKRIYTEDEVKQAKTQIDNGYRHRLKIKGSSDFKRKAKQAIDHIKTAGYYDFFRTYVKEVEEIDGLTQLRQSEASIWANKYTVKNPVDAASIFVQKANRMKEYLEGKLYYGGQAEKRSDQKRIEFLEALERKSRETEVTAECERLIKLWKESSLVY
jgi:hypothetical protein